MKKFFAVIALVGLTFSPNVNAQTSPDPRFPVFDTAAAAQHHCPFDMVVWLNIKSDTYNINGPQQGDKKEDGAYVCQRDADQMDDHFKADAK